MSLNSNQLQNHSIFITVVGRWARGTPHNPRTRDHGLLVRGEKKVKFESNINDLLPMQSGRVAELS